MSKVTTDRSNATQAPVTAGALQSLELRSSELVGDLLRKSSTATKFQNVSSLPIEPEHQIWLECLCPSAQRMVNSLLNNATQALVTAGAFETIEKSSELVEDQLNPRWTANKSHLVL